MDKTNVMRILQQKKIEFKDYQKYVNWIYIYKKGYNRFYIILQHFERIPVIN